MNYNSLDFCFGLCYIKICKHACFTAFKIAPLNLILGAVSHHPSQQGYSHAEKDVSIKGILESVVGIYILNRYLLFRGSAFYLKLHLHVWAVKCCH